MLKSVYWKEENLLKECGRGAIANRGQLDVNVLVIPVLLRQRQQVPRAHWLVSLG